jgi:hypothetical protein
VRTHPVTGLKALNINPGFVTDFAELKKKESDKLKEFFDYHIHSAGMTVLEWQSPRHDTKANGLRRPPSPMEVGGRLRSILGQQVSQ